MTITSIAQTALADTMEILLVVGALIALLMVGGAVIMMYRRRLLSDNQDAPQHSSMLDELRRALESGELSDDEYERARHAVVDRARGADPVRREPISQPTARWDRTAEPGVDLTGAPLPRPGEQSSGEKDSGGRAGDRGAGSDNPNDGGE